MAPEQIRGERADARSDIWAFGCLLFEMLTGERSFAGASAAEIMAAVLRDEVDWSRLPPEAPAALRRLARRCLAREKADRLQDIGDARVELQALERGESEETSPPRRKPETAFWRRALPWGLGAALFAALAASLVPRPPGPLAAPVAAARLGLGLPPGLALEEDYAAPFTLTPDGRRLALLARREGPPLLYVRELDSVELRALEGTEEAWQPFFSPDGQELAFFADRKLKRVPLSGGAPRTVAEVGDNPRGGAFGEDGAIVLAPSYNTGLSRMPPSGGGAVPLTELDLRRGESSHRWPQVLPGGEWAVFTVGYEGESYDDAAVEAVSLARGERRRLVTGGAFGRYVAGQLLYAQAGRLLAVPMDLSPPALRGEPQVALENIRYDPRNGSTHLAVARVEALLYQGGVPASFEHHLAFVDLEGRLSRFEGPARRFREPRLSPDGRRVAVVIGPAAGSDLWVADVGASTLTRVTFGLSPRRPVWTPDGSGVTVGVAVGDRFQLQTLGIAGGGSPAVLYESAQWVFPSDWSADGRRLVFQERRAETGWDLRLLDFPEPGGSGVVRDLAAGPHQETNATVSPDGRMFAYESDELDGVVEVYVRPLEAPGAHVRVTRLGANWPRFGRGGELYYWVAPRVHPGGQRLAEGLHRLDLRWSGGAITPGPASPVWPVGVRGPALFDRLQVAAFAAYDIEPTRPVRRFLALESLPAAGAPPAAGPVVVLGGLGVPQVPPSRGDAPRP
jgi:serine/threonine-protein kinase